MAERTFQCSIITPEGKTFEGQVTSVVIPAHDGQLGILVNRAPLLCKLGVGPMRIDSPEGEKSWLVDGGFGQVTDNRVTILTQEAIEAESIDREKAQAMLDEARQIRPTDEVAVRRKERQEAGARARLRMAP